MSTPAPPSPGELQTSLKGIIELLGHRASPRISDFTRLATAVQRERHVAGKSDTAELTRSAAMWTILHLDAPLRGVMPAGTEQQLGRLIGIGSAMPPAQGPEAGLNKDFERAVHSYLTTLGQPRFIDLADLTVAILHDARDLSLGLFPRRLRNLGIDIEATIAAVVPLTNRAPLRSAVEGTAYSASVLGVRERLGPDTAVTAAQIAEALQVDHPTYGGETFAKVRLRTSDGPTRATDEWLAGVSELYTPDAVAASKHQVIDGVLVLLGLAELDATLEEDLRSRGFLARLRLEANVLPRTDVQDHTRWASALPGRRR